MCVGTNVLGSDSSVGSGLDKKIINTSNNQSLLNTSKNTTASSLSKQENETLQSPSPSQSAQIEQANVNQYLLQEMRRMQEEQRHLNEEILQLKLKNMHISNELETIKRYTSELSKALPFSAPPNYAQFETMNSHMGEPPMVVYDLSKGTARVLTANAIFCQMLGYDMSEVLNQDWTKFIHPQYLPKIHEQITQRRLMHSERLEIDQCYQHRSGAVFWTKDTMVIFHDVSGSALTAFVTVSFVKNQGSQNYPVIAPKPAVPSIDYIQPLTPSEPSPIPPYTESPMLFSPTPSDSGTPYPHGSEYSDLKMFDDDEEFEKIINEIYKGSDQQSPFEKDPTSKQN